MEDASERNSLSWLSRPAIAAAARRTKKGPFASRIAMERAEPSSSDSRPSHSGSLPVARPSSSSHAS